MLRVMIVDDAETSRLLLRHAINSTPDMRIVGEAHDGLQAVEMVNSLKPDVILMDITMPNMDGLEATRQIMGRLPTPIIMVSGTVAGRETEIAFQAMKLGALTLLAKPVGPAHPAYTAQINHLTKTVRTLASVQVITHRAAVPRNRGGNLTGILIENVAPANVEVIVIGASTGGPAALSEIIRNLSADFSLPIVVGQHIAAEFVPSLCNWLDSLTPLTVRMAEIGGKPEAGCIDVAPANTSLEFNRKGRYVDNDAFNTLYKPSIDLLFQSAARVFQERAAGVILTGMGSDGAAGLRELFQTGAYTLAQDEATSAVYGMPKEAVAREAVKQVLPLSRIASTLNYIAKNKEIDYG